MFKRSALLFALTLSGALLSAGAAQAEAGLTPAPGQIEFGPVDLHFGGSARQSVTFANESRLPVLVFSTIIAGANASSFQVSDDDCSGRQLEPDEGCSVELSYQPSARGAQSASLELLDNGGTLAVPLSGAGLTGTLSANPSPLAFSPIPYTPPNHEGEYQETEQITVQNSQDAGTQIESASITGPDASSFSIQWSNCEHDLLGPGNSCDVQVRFAASSPGPKRASLVLDSDSSGTPLVVPLEAQALHGPEVSVDSTEALLGEVPIGSSSQHTFTITNSGDYPLYIQQDFLISGTPLLFPVLSDSCGGQIVYPSASCALTVGFEPTSTGEKDAAIILITNASPIHVLGIDATGVHRTVSAPSLAPAPSEPYPPATSTNGEASAASAGLSAGSGSGSSPALTADRTPHLYGSIARAALDTGFTAQCPDGPTGCETVSFITASVPASSTRRSASGPRNTPELLGSAVTQLHGGKSSRVRIPLSRHALSLLRQLGHLRARIQTFIRVQGRIVAERTFVVTLTAPGGAPRTTAARTR